MIKVSILVSNTLLSLAISLERSIITVTNQNQYLRSVNVTLLLFLSVENQLEDLHLWTTGHLRVSFYVAQGLPLKRVFAKD